MCPAHSPTRAGDYFASASATVAVSCLGRFVAHIAVGGYCFAAMSFGVPVTTTTYGAAAFDTVFSFLALHSSLLFR